MAKKNEIKTTQGKKEYPFVVVVLGHVDHGKTTLLDAIRKTKIAQKEYGEITQNIYISSLEVLHEKIKRRLTFIDTPGHETFSKMRSRGAQVADLGLLVVSLTDGVMPQTKEAIKLLKEAKIPFVVVLTKADLPEKNPEKVKQQLIQEGVQLETLGGDVPFIEVSAPKNKNINELLELIILTYDLEKNAKKPDQTETGQFKAVVVESKLDPKIGPKATMVIKNGTVLVKDELFCEGMEGKVRAIVNDRGQRVPSATVGEAVEILGFEKVPPVGGLVYKKKDLAIEEVSLLSRALEPRSQKAVQPQSPFKRELEEKPLSIILCADTQGSLEAIVNVLPKKIEFVLQKTGEITRADILMAKSVNAIIIGFNLKLKAEIIKLALTEKVILKNYKIIYELIDEIKDVLEGKELALEEKIYGKAKILASFPFEKNRVMGVVVLEGRIAKGDKVRLLRKEETIGEGMIISIRQGKNPTSKVEKGEEAGVIVSPSLDFLLGDMLVCHGQFR